MSRIKIYIYPSINIGLKINWSLVGWLYHFYGLIYTQNLPQKVSYFKIFMASGVKRLMNTSSAKFPDLGVRSPNFLTKNWPLTILPTFPIYSRLIFDNHSFILKIMEKVTDWSPEATICCGKIKKSPGDTPSWAFPLLGARDRLRRPSSRF